MKYNLGKPIYPPSVRCPAMRLAAHSRIGQLLHGAFMSSCRVSLAFDTRKFKK